LSNVLSNEEPTVNSSEKPVVEPGPAVKKKFIEPEISVPVDVLEATTFFQTVSSGPTTP
jgi:hypothetical protein